MPKVSNHQNIYFYRDIQRSHYPTKLISHLQADFSTYILRFAYRCHEENGIALIATVNNQRREIVVEGVIPKGEVPEKVKVLIIHQLGDYVKNKQTLSSR